MTLAVTSPGWSAARRPEDHCAQAHDGRDTIRATRDGALTFRHDNGGAGRSVHGWQNPDVLRRPGNDSTKDNGR